MAGLFFGAVIAPGVSWYVAMIGSLLVLLSIEFLNTAIEKLSDHVTPEHHIQIGRIKDYGSASCSAVSALPGWSGLPRSRSVVGGCEGASCRSPMPLAERPEPWSASFRRIRPIRSKPVTRS